jgi:hypothetical protein
MTRPQANTRLLLTWLCRQGPCLAPCKLMCPRSRSANRQVDIEPGSLRDDGCDAIQGEVCD